MLTAASPGRRVARGSPCTTTHWPRPLTLVADVTRRRYPDLQIPFHSRWRHFEAGGVDRKAELARLVADAGPAP